MARKKKELPLFKKVEIADAGAEGKAVARVENQVVFVPYVVPGDIVDIQVTRKKRSYMEGRAVKLHFPSPKRTEPLCSHFGTCGGCKWQNMVYQEQLFYKQKQVEDHFKRIGRFGFPPVKPILPSNQEFRYRNKLEFSFSSRVWMTEPPAGDRDRPRPSGLGFHLPGMFDRIIDIDQCHLQDMQSDVIRKEIKSIALDTGLSFFDERAMKGFFRNLIIRNTSGGEWMVILVFGEDLEEEILQFMHRSRDRFAEDISWHYVVNIKGNDDISDLPAVHFAGKAFLTEEVPVPGRKEGPLKFKISPQSFFQTNPLQAARLYQAAIDLAGLTGDETVYDLYSGAGTIACYLAGMARQVTGIEYNVGATLDARENAAMNGIHNSFFFSGDIVKVMDDAFIRATGIPDVIVTDPPRAGMHEKVVSKIAEIGPARIVYISCNPATQARDIALLSAQFDVAAVQPVDMFPQTQHVENIALLVKRGQV